MLFRIRDHWLRWVARRKNLIVPSLLADVAPTLAEEAEVLGTDAPAPTEKTEEDTAEATVGGTP